MQWTFFSDGASDEDEAACGGGADHDDFSLCASSHAAPRHAGFWLDRLRHVRGTTTEGVEGRTSVTAALGPDTCSGA